jgi:hypothetical protein
MKVSSKKILSVLGCVVAACLAIYAARILNVTTPKISRDSFRWNVKNSNLQKADYAATMLIDIYEHSQELMRFRFDGCVVGLRANGTSVPLETLGKQDFCDTKLGFVLPLSKFLVLGSNQVEFDVVDKSESPRFDALPTLKDSVYFSHYLLFALGLILVAELLLTRLKVPTKIKVIMLLTLAMQVYVASKTSVSEAAHDWHGHLDYVKYIAENKSLPPTNACWECHQPPTYYTIAALFYAPFGEFGIKFLSLIIYFVFLYVAFLIIQRSIRNADIQVVLALMLCSLPTGFGHAIRVGNDQLFYLFHSLCFLYLLKWEDKPSPKTLLKSSIFGGLGFLAKATGILSFIFVFFAVVLRYVKESSLKLRHFFYAATSWFLVFVFYGSHLILRKAVIAIQQTAQFDLQRIGNPLSSFVLFDLSAFLSVPVPSVHSDESGRQFFWNQFLKTSYLSIFERESPFHTVSATIVNVLFLAPLVLLIFGLSCWASAKLKYRSSHALNLFIAIGATMAFRLSFPFACANDFRYVFPVVISALCFVGLGIESLKLPLLRRIAYMSVVAFSVAGFLHVGIDNFLKSR